MGFFDKIDNNMVVDTIKQFLNRTDLEIFYGYPSNWYIPQEYRPTLLPGKFTKTTRW